MIDLYTAPGIGDVYWVLCKLAKQLQKENRKLIIHTPEGNTPQHKRSKFLEYLPFVETTRADGIAYTEVIKLTKAYKNLQDLMFLEVNTWLEAGKRLENFMPWFEIEYKLEWHVSDEHKQRAESVLKKDKMNIVLYTSGIKNNNNPSTGNWSIEKWGPILFEIQRRSDINLIWIGASYDLDTHQKFNIQGYRLLDEPAPVIIHLLRNCDKFISYQSGLSCISVMEQIPTYMMYFPKIDKLRYTFCPPESINNPALYSAEFFENSDVKSIMNWLDS